MPLLLISPPNTDTGVAIIITILMALFIIITMSAIILGVRRHLQPSPQRAIQLYTPVPRLPGHAFLYGLAYIGHGLIKRQFTPATHLHAHALIQRAQRTYAQQYTIIQEDIPDEKEEEVWDDEEEELPQPPPDDLTLRIEQAKRGEGVMPLAEIAEKRPYLFASILPDFIERFCTLWTRNGGNIGPRDRGKTKPGFVRHPQDSPDESHLKFARREYEELLDILSEGQFIAIIKQEGKEIGKNIHDGQDGYNIERWKTNVLKWIAERYSKGRNEPF